MFELHKTQMQNSILKDVQSTSTVTTPHVTAQENKWKECNLAHHTDNTHARMHARCRNHTRSSPRRVQVFPVQNQTVKNARGVKTTAAGGPQTGTMCHRVGGWGARAEVTLQVFHRTQPGEACVFDSWFYWNI